VRSRPQRAPQRGPAHQRFATAYDSKGRCVTNTRITWPTSNARCQVEGGQQSPRVRRVVAKDGCGRSVEARVDIDVVCDGTVEVGG